MSARKRHPGVRIDGMSRGITIFGALVAFSVAGLGSAAVSGVYIASRSSLDTLSQRDEAMRIARNDIEAMRGFDTSRLWGRISSTALASTVNGTSAVFTVSRSVSSGNYGLMKTVKTQVAWNDRKGASNTISLTSAIGSAMPELSGASLSPLQSGNPYPILGQNPQIPQSAKLLGAISGYVAPGQTGTNNVAWVFNSLTGEITKRCTVTATTSNALTLSDVGDSATSCTAVSRRLLSGIVRFGAGGGSPYTDTGIWRNLSIAISLTSTPAAAGDGLPDYECFSDAGTSFTSGAPAVNGYVTYSCAVKPNTSGVWSGKSNIVPQPFASTNRGVTTYSYWAISGTLVDAGYTGGSWTGTAYYRVCRFTYLQNDALGSPDNSWHPLLYNGAGNLTSQNFLLMPSTSSCPSGTLLHQSGVPPYN